GRIAAPIFFFLIGFARTRSAPWTWAAFGVGLTAFSAWTLRHTADPQNYHLNILLNFVLLRLAVLPLMEWLLRRRPVALTLFVVGCALLAGLTDRYLEYGTGGWLWALLGLSHRMHLENPRPVLGWARLAFALAAASALVVWESIDLAFSAAQVVVFA